MKGKRSIWGETSVIHLLEMFHNCLWEQSRCRIQKRTGPPKEFRAFVQIAQRYVEMTKDDPLIHKSVTRCVNGLREYLEVERSRVPEDVLFQADRLECLVFAGYDPSFEGDEPPGL